jgi:subtilase family serine protease
MKKSIGKWFLIAICLISIFLLLTMQPKVHAADLPDLVITDLIWSPENPNAGDAVTFSVVVTNQGSAATPDGVVTGVGFQIDGGQTEFWSDSYKKSIAPGETVTLAMTGGVSGPTWRAKPGKHTISAWVNDVKRYQESNFGNNPFKKAMPPITGTMPADTPKASLPDMIITDLTWEPATPVAGDEVKFSVVVKNQGSKATPEGIVCGVGFQVDGQPTSFWSDNYSKSIAPGESVTLTMNGGVNSSVWKALAGTHTISAWVNDVKRFQEASFNNNTIKKTTPKIAAE